MSHEADELIKAAGKFIATWAISSFWWISFYLYQVSKWERFRLGSFLINAFLAFWIGTIVWEFIPLDSSYRDWIIGISWFSTFPLLDLLEKRAANFIYNKIDKVWTDEK